MWGQAQRVVQPPLQACVQFGFTLFSFVETSQQGDTQEWYQRNQESYKCKFLVVGVIHKREVKELKGHTMQVLYDGYRMQEREQRTQASHNAHSGWWVSIFLRQRTLQFFC